MNARFATLLVLLACFCIAATTAIDAAASSNSSSPSASTSASSSALDSCPDDYKCLGNSESHCNASWTQDVKGQCEASNGAGCCAYGLICVSGTCQTNNFGVTCNATYPCYSGAGEILTCNKTTSTCAYLSFAGDGCDSDNNCIIGFTCNSDKICVGASDGQDCSTTPCSAGFYCNITNIKSPTCVSLGTTDSECSSDSQCAANLYCDDSDPKNSTCQALFTVSAGNPCNITNQCNDGLFCQKNKCTELDSDYDKCTADSDCSNGGTCTCSKFSGDSYCVGGDFTPSQSYAEGALNCQAKYNCTSPSLNSESCFYQNCYSDLKDIQSSGCDGNDNVYGSCYYSDYCGGFPAWAIALIIIGAIAVVLACVAVVFVAMRRKNTYDSI